MRRQRRIPSTSGRPAISNAFDMELLLCTKCLAGYVDRLVSRAQHRPHNAPALLAIIPALSNRPAHQVRPAHGLTITLPADGSGYCAASSAAMFDQRMRLSLPASSRSCGLA